ncbi:AAA family ATPase [Frigidibacter sp. MR17.14]|uniref:AAA family ATPase n=1 Tax=Frigidibacter sp. MR17.14 TaxID=3126509 RepID=UPI003012FD2E
MRPSLVLLAGPNGSGKTTLYQTRVAPSFAGPFINADIIQKDELGDPSPEASYEAAKIAARRREEHLSARRSFVTETVFSHPSKLEIIETARSAGFIVIVMHISTDDADLNVARVRARTQEGGHDVPEAKIRARYSRGGPLIRRAVLAADRGMVFDNSKLNAPPEMMLLFSAGRLTRVAPKLPGWMLDAYDQDLRFA